MGWQPWSNVSGLRAQLGSLIGVVARKPDHLDLFVTGTDGRIYVTSRREGRLFNHVSKCSPELPPTGVERPGRMVRFARLMHRPVRVLGGPAVRAAYGGNLSLAWLPPTVISQRTRYRGLTGALG